MSHTFVGFLGLSVSTSVKSCSKALLQVPSRNCVEAATLNFLDRNVGLRAFRRVPIANVAVGTRNRLRAETYEPWRACTCLRCWNIKAPDTKILFLRRLALFIRSVACHSVPPAPAQESISQEFVVSSSVLSKLWQHMTKAFFPRHEQRNVTCKLVLLRVGWS